MITTLNAVTADSGIALHLTEEDARDFHALPSLPDPEPEDFEAPDVIVIDVVTGRTWMVSRFGLAIGNCQCGCAAYAEDITESWEAFVAEEDERADEDEPLIAFTYGGGELPLTLAPEDMAELNALPRLPQQMPEDFEPPSVIVTDIATGRTYWMARALCGLACDCRAYAEDITESWEAFLAQERPLAADPCSTRDGPALHTSENGAVRIHTICPVRPIQRPTVAWRCRRHA